MIIANGQICYKKKMCGGLAENGNPVRPTSEWSEPIPCNIKLNKSSNVGKVNGNSFTVASYELLVEVESFDAEQIKISDSSGKELGEFSVLSADPLYAVGTIKILV